MPSMTSKVQKSAKTKSLGPAALGQVDLIHLLMLTEQDPKVLARTPVILPIPNYHSVFQGQAGHAAVPQHGSPESAESPIQTEPVQPTG